MLRFQVGTFVLRLHVDNEVYRFVILKYSPKFCGPKERCGSLNGMRTIVRRLRSVESLEFEIRKRSHRSHWQPECDLMFNLKFAVLSCSVCY